MVGADTGGFNGNTDEELLGRWMMVSVFSSLWFASGFWGKLFLWAFFFYCGRSSPVRSVYSVDNCMSKPKISILLSGYFLDYIGC